jgi:hypothetical protein
MKIFANEYPINYPHVIYKLSKQRKKTDKPYHNLIRFILLKGDKIYIELNKQSLRVRVIVVLN